MEKLGLNEIRERFLRFFESKGHLRLKSFPLVPQNDNSLLLINAGMAPLKHYFTGELTPPAPRVTDCQKCIRTLDIDSVGKDARHGTYFEMLGNFSFGDYFKREACQWAWEFITQEMKMPVDKLYVSVFLDDDEAYDIWTKEIGVQEDHMVRLGREDNFWEIGSGPCGPCSEIYFDRGEKYGCGSPDCAPGCDCDRYVEFWNLVFSQFSSDGKGNYTPLARKNIDTGMGIERLACIMQDVDSLFDVDTVHRILDHVAQLSGVTYGKDKKQDVSLRIITDHIRSSVMLVCDGVIPSNEGRGYVLRRLLRRAARHGRLLGLTQPFLAEVAETVIKENEGAYPELREKEEYIKKLIRTEEERFAATVESGLVKLDEMIAALRGNGDTLSGEDAFKLYDTYGFPVDLTVEILEEQGFKLARQAFEEMMRAQRERARQARGNTTGLGWAGDDVSLKELPATVFTGYDKLEDTGKVLAIVTEGELAGSLGQGAQGTLVLDQTPFYAESGGQSWDTGVMRREGTLLQVLAVRKTADGKFLHQVEALEGTVNVDDTLQVHVDEDRRRAIMRAHSATHLLQKALRTVLGNHVEQAGSLVEPDRLRFDFTHFSAVTPEELMEVEKQVNEEILRDDVVNISEMSIDEAKKLGAMALFGEKYGDRVRVVQMGDYSIELCGGTHVPNTARVGLLKIVSEASAAAGVRRIEAVVGSQVAAMLHEKEQMIARAAAAIKSSPMELVNKVQKTMNDLRQALHKVDKLSARVAALRSVEMLNFAHTAGDSGVNVLAMKVDDMSSDMLRTLSDDLRDKAPNLVSVLALVTEEGKINFVAACGKEAVKKGAHAGNILKQVAKMTGGGGGGRPDSATAGGKDPSKLEAALEAVNNIVEEMVK